MLRFQSTFPRGERRFLRGGSRLVSYFNPRSLVGTDGLRRAACPLLFYFNPRSLVGNDGNQNIRRNQNGNFNPRSLVGNDVTNADYSAGLKISIHVPSWGTTTLSGSASLRSVYFNPRSLVGNDGRPGCFVLLISLFQSTFPRGERRQIFTNILCFFMQ